MNMNANRVTWVSIRLAPTPRLACGAKLCSEWVDTTPSCLTRRIAATCTSRGAGGRGGEGGGARWGRASGLGPGGVEDRAHRVSLPGRAEPAGGCELEV